MSIEERIRSRAIRQGSDCLIWTGAINHKGYGLIKIAGKVQRVHRAMFEAVNGGIPDGRQVDHTCHEPACVNPKHLRAATNKQNRENLSGATVKSKTGVRGVWWDKRERKWRARVKHNDVAVMDRHFTSIEEAEAAVIAKRNEVYTHNDVDRQTPHVVATPSEAVTEGADQ